jgi:hypothetical protein
MDPTDLPKKKIRATDAKEVRVENPAEETCCYPNQIFDELIPSLVAACRVLCLACHTW